jgi:hypothetical protein
MIFIVTVWRTSHFVDLIELIFKETVILVVVLLFISFVLRIQVRKICSDYVISKSVPY